MGGKPSAQCPQHAAGLSRLLSSHFTERNMDVQKAFSDIRGLPCLYHSFCFSELSKFHHRATVKNRMEGGTVVAQNMSSGPKDLWIFVNFFFPFLPIQHQSRATFL